MGTEKALRWKPLLAVVIVLGVVMGTIAAALLPDATAEPALSAVYLLPSAPYDASMLPAPLVELQAQGIKAVRSMDDLRDEVGPDTDAILIHRGALPEADSAWLRAQYDAGKVMVGININMVELAELFPPAVPSDASPKDFGPWSTYSPDRRFYSMLVRGPYSASMRAPACGSASQDHFDYGLNGLQLMLSRIASDRECGLAEAE
jgi:hypothetical protein